MKKWTAMFLCLVLLVPGTGARAAGGRDVSFEAELAQSLQELDLFRGVGEGAEGSAEFALERAPSRVEAVVMLVRSLGKGTEAEALARTHPFTDVPAWADGYVSYAYEQELARGVSDTRFGAEDPVTAEMYLTFTLRALGYSDQWDFGWDWPWALAAWTGILPPRVDWDHFLRADAVDVTAAALYASLKGGETPLHTKLEREGAFTAERFAEVFPTDPFADYRRIDQQLTAAVADRVPLGQVSGSRYRSEHHIILDVAEGDGVLTVTAFGSYSNVDLLEDNTIGNDGYNGIAPQLWLLELDLESQERRSFRMEEELTAEGRAVEDCFPAHVLEKRDRAWSSGVHIPALDAKRELNLGHVGYRASTHDEALLDILDAFGYYEGQRLETADCTILQYYIGGTSRGTFASLALIYKPGSTPGDGAVVSLPIPGDWEWYQNSDGPDTLELSQDQKTLTYTYHFDERRATSYSEGTETVAHEAGTYVYTVDLPSGEFSLEIVPN